MVSSTEKSSESKIFRLECQPNNYPWGKVGKDSLAGVLASESAGGDFKLDPSEPYAELWMGTHPHNPAKLWGKDQLLSDYLSKHKELLGEAIKFPARYPDAKEDKSEGGEGHVPFLFKILTCKQALPLQIHPNREIAEKLHKENPEQFPDTNHKPEIAVCLSDKFLGFAGFRPSKVIRSLVVAVPEIDQLPSKAKDAIQAFIASASDSTEVMRKAWQAVIEMEGSEVEAAVKAFSQRVKTQGVDAFSDVGDELDKGERENLVVAAQSLDKYYPGDGSAFATLFFMNLVELKKGEGMYVGADGPHAWLEGEIVELMAASDNVLNVGFTPEKDSTSLVARTVSGTPHTPADLKLKSQSFSKGSKGHTTVYAVPFEEFSILRIDGQEVLAPLSGPGIAIVTESKGTVVAGNEAKSGSVWFVGAGSELVVEGDGVVWMAFYDGDQESKGQVGKQ
ncbi:putative mannose-6-phosphateisomerase [Naematelia encephala]|uniref:Mannose-6-phosphate isomerase n=1 Tax=Naematelia encephala TaxID=71784 RepID=A0A1Y2AEB2_9TREE|nr:putative mannose-6-phosphateisomerase [Naematelia encephala]